MLTLQKRLPSHFRVSVGGGERDYDFTESGLNSAYQKNVWVVGLGEDGKRTWQGKTHDRTVNESNMDYTYEGDYSRATGTSYTQYYGTVTGQISGTVQGSGGKASLSVTDSVRRESGVDGSYQTKTDSVTETRNVSSNWSEGRYTGEGDYQRRPAGMDGLVVEGTVNEDGQREDGQKGPPNY